MAYEYKASVVTKNSNTYNSVEEFVAEHGPLGLSSSSEFVQSATAELNEDKTGVIRTMTFDSEAAMNNWREATGKKPGSITTCNATLISRKMV